MTINRKKGLVGAVIGMVLILAIVLLGRYSSKKSEYSCCRIPLFDGRLSWGMDTDEVIAVAGEPSSIEHSEYGDTLTYDMALPCDLGNCVEAVFIIGFDNRVYNDEIISTGLGDIELTVELDSKDAVMEELSGFYGELSADGGETQMEAQFKGTNPDFFYQYHFCEEWRAGTLPEETFDRLLQVKQPIPDRIALPMDKDTPLMYVNFWGTEGYPCKIRLEASELASYLYIE